MSETYHIPTAAQSIPTNPGKPKKPYDGFPLTAHATGRWCKKIRGHIHYFGVWADPEAALNEYMKVRDDLHAGREPRLSPEQEGLVTVKTVCNAFLNFKAGYVASGELSPRTMEDLKIAAKILIKAMGGSRAAADLRIEDFTSLRVALAKRYGRARLGNSIVRIRMIFKHALEIDLLTRPMKFGPGFKAPTKKANRIYRSKLPPKLFTRDEINRMLAEAGQPLKAMLLLAINAGFGNSDAATLPITALDLEGGFVVYPRPKTGVERRAPLWPETVQAIQEAISRRPEPRNPEHSLLTFITKYGEPWFKETSDNPIAKETKKLLKSLGINGRKGLGFYTLRHTFRTIADAQKDQPAIFHIMGHELPDMSSVYRERISDGRLKEVTEHVRKWLFGDATNALENGLS